MTVCGLLLCAVLLAGSPVDGDRNAAVWAPPGLQLPAPAAARDAWLGEDKVRHFMMSFGITTLGYGAARAAGVETATARLAAVTGSGAAGVAKEVRDLSVGGPFSVRDLAWDIAGTAAGLLVVSNIR